MRSLPTSIDPTLPERAMPSRSARTSTAASFAPPALGSIEAFCAERGRVLTRAGHADGGTHERAPSAVACYVGEKERPRLQVAAP